MDYRNHRLGHVNYLLVSEESYEERVGEYDKVVAEIQRLTHTELDRIFNEYIIGIDSALEITKDEIETNLIVPNGLSDKDLECLATECLIKSGLVYDQIKSILEDDFGIYVRLAD